jgi:tRNA (guanine-N7-)-methyltransferase
LLFKDGMLTKLAQNAQPLCILYDLPSILARIEPLNLFPNAQPLEVELGAGDGSFLVQYAQRHSERNFIAIERLLGRARKLERKSRQAGLTNLRAIRIESSYFIRYLIPAGSVSTLHIYFPDPWPKRKHHRHRLINEEFPAWARQALRSAGMVFLRTDDRDYFDQMIAVFSTSPLFRQFVTPPELAALLTDFEKEFQARGIPTLRAGFQAV